MFLFQGIQFADSFFTLYLVSNTVPRKNYLLCLKLGQIHLEMIIDKQDPIPLKENIPSKCVSWEYYISSYIYHLLYSTFRSSS